jgi:adenylate cyclase class 2
MAIEIELKARLDGPGAVGERLNALAVYEGSYEKNDTYWIAAGNVSGEGSGLRVRRESRVGASGRAGASVLITYKTKEFRDGIEVNDEREFYVSGGEDRSGDPADFGGAEVFEELLYRLKLRPDIRKEKRGRAWTVPGPPFPSITVELSLARDLGWFVELEILADDRDEKTIVESRARLLALLDSLGVPRERIEGRTYTEMLRGLSRKP